MVSIRGPLVKVAGLDPFPRAQESSPLGAGTWGAAVTSTPLCTPEIHKPQSPQRHHQNACICLITGLSW